MEIKSSPTVHENQHPTPSINSIPSNNQNLPMKIVFVKCLKENQPTRNLTKIRTNRKKPLRQDNRG